jgi:hypothetical protein
MIGARIATPINAATEAATPITNRDRRPAATARVTAAPWDR